MAANVGTSGTWMRSSSLVADPVVAANSPFAAASYGGRRFLTDAVTRPGGCHADQVLVRRRAGPAVWLPGRDRRRGPRHLLHLGRRRSALAARRAPRRRQPLGVGVQLCTLSWLGFVPDDLAPPRRRRCAVWPTSSPAMSACWSTTADGRTAPAAIICARYSPGGLAGAGTGDFKKLDDFLLARAMEHDSPTLLLRLAAEHLRAERVVRPAVDPLVRRVATARDRAWTETYTRLSTTPTAPANHASWTAGGGRSWSWDHPVGVAAPRCHLGRPRGRESRARKLAYPGPRRRPPGTASRPARPTTFPGPGRVPLDSPSADPSRPPTPSPGPAGHAGRDRSGDHSTSSVTLFDQASHSDSRARHRLDGRPGLPRVAAAEDHLVLLDDCSAVLADPAVPDEAVGPLLRGRDRPGRLRRRALVSERPRRDRGHLELLEARYAYLRSFTPA